MSSTAPETAAALNPFANGAAFIDGCYVPIAEARLPVLDWGFTRSDVTYDVVHVWKGAFFRLDDHLERFQRSCSSLRLSPPSNDEIREVLMRCVALSGLKDSYVEMTCTRGVPAPGSRDPRTCKNNFLAFAIPFVWVVTPEQQARGAHIWISNIPRIAPASVDPTVKNFHWGDLTRALFEAFDQGADTAVLVDAEGNISEGPGFNVFCVLDGKVVSPGDTVLRGITRESVRELCEELGIPFAIGKVTPDDMRNADEVFLSTTAGGVMPVSRVDGRRLSNDRPGPVSIRLKDLYWEKHDQGWHCTPVDYAICER